MGVDDSPPIPAPARLPATRPTEADKDAAIARAIEMAAEGQYLTVIASELGLPYERLRLWVLSKQPEAYRGAQSKALAMRIVEADERLDKVKAGPNGFFHLKKADVQCKWTRFDAERRDPNNWAPRQEITGAGGAPNRSGRRMYRGTPVTRSTSRMRPMGTVSPQRLTAAPVMFNSLASVLASPAAILAAARPVTVWSLAIVMTGKLI